MRRIRETVAKNDSGLLDRLLPCRRRHLPFFLMLRKALSVKRFDLAFYLDRHRIALAVTRLTGSNLDPAFANTIFLDIDASLVIELDANIVLENSRIVVRAALIDR